MLFKDIRESVEVTFYFAFFFMALRASPDMNKDGYEKGSWREFASPTLR